MKYIEYINKLIKNKVSETENIVLFGQNISAGSCLGGLIKGLRAKAGSFIINTPNSENTLVGVGFGLMLNGVSSIFFMKQLDFLLLGVDHLVNTYNFIRIKNSRASFTIMPIVVDLGYQGMQSSLNNFGDFCSIARISGYTVTNKQDADYIIGSHLVSPGFRIIGVSQRLFNNDILDNKKTIVPNNGGEICQYYSGENATIVCFNFSFPQGFKIYNELRVKGLNSSLFSVNAVVSVDWTPIIDSIKITKKLIILDDSKCVNRSCYSLIANAYENCFVDVVLLFARDCTDELLCPNPEEFIVSTDVILKRLTKK